MTLGKFITKYIEYNSIVRLLYKNKLGHSTVLPDWNDVSMEHEILKCKGKNRHYINNEVEGITSVLAHGHYPEAINIVIKPMDNQPFLEESILKQNNCESL